MATKRKTVDDDRIARTQWDRYVRARDHGHLDYMTIAKKCDDFYMGAQWDPEDKAELDAAGRPALTINMILTTVNTVLGEQIARRVDLRFKPAKGGKQDTANILSKVWDQIARDNKYAWVEQEVFADGVILDGRGFFDVRIDFSKSIQGTVSIRALDPLNVLLDPDAKDYDPKTWNEVFNTFWMSIDEIESTYGAAVAEKLRFIAENGNMLDSDSIEMREDRFGQTSTTFTGQPSGAPDHKDASNIKRLRVIERQHVRMSRREFFVDQQVGDERAVPENWSETKSRQFAKKYGLSIISRADRRVRWTVTCDQTVLHDEWSPYKTFSIIPYFAYFRRGRPFGMIRNLLSPQEQLNKSSSQELHVINTTANSGWVIENGSLTTLKPEDLERSGAQTGIVVEYNRGRAEPRKIAPNQIPTGLDRVSQKAEASIRTISGVNESMLNADASEKSEIKSQSQRARGTIMMQVPLDNLGKTRHFLAEKVLDLVQNFYTEERIVMITDEEDPLEPREPVVANQETPEGYVINDLTVGLYDIIVGTVPSRDSYDDTQLLEALALRQAGVMIPDDIIVKYSHLADKAQLAKRIRVQNGVEKSPEQQEMDQFQQQLAMQGLQLQIEELAAKIQKLKSEAALNISKMQDTADIQPQLAVQKLQTELEQRMRELDLRRELATLSAQSRDNQAQTTAATRIATTAMSTAVRRDMNNQKQEEKNAASKAGK